jgi:hypothetical protein
VNVKETMLPFVAIKTPNTVVSVNFGQEPFKFDVTDERQRKQRKEIDEKIKLELMQVEQERIEKQKTQQKAAFEQRKNQVSIY